MSFRSDEQRKAIFARLGQTKNRVGSRIRQRYQGVAPGDAAVRGLGVGIATSAALSFGGLAGVGVAHAFARRFKGPSAFKILKAAKQEFPNLKRNLQVVRTPLAWMSGGGAVLDVKSNPFPRAATALAKQVGMKLKGTKRTAGILLPPRTTGKYRIPAPIMVHELGHLRTNSLLSNPKTLSNPTSFMRLKEEFLATKHGARVWKKAGGSSKQYWGTLIPALTSYAGQNAGVFGAASLVGAATIKSPSKKRTKK